MNTGRAYRLKHLIPWSRRQLYFMLLVSAIPTLLYHFLGWKWLAIPWVPVALIGTAAAFIVGFRNTQTYSRLWEARKIWGAIVNDSRTWGIMARDFVRSENKEVHRQLFYRHFAWLTALRFQLRESKSWENIKSRSYNREYLKYYKVPEWEGDLGNELKPYLSKKEYLYILSKGNKASQLLALQSAHIQRLNVEGTVSDLNYVEMQNLLRGLYTHQGASERIKNFPYPRQFSSISMYFVYALALMLPLGFLHEFSKLAPGFIWLTIPFSILVGWVFLVLEQIGESTENPFEGGANDVPITSMSKSIESDMREMLDEKDLPPPVAAQNEILM